MPVVVDALIRDAFGDLPLMTPRPRRPDSPSHFLVDTLQHTRIGKCSEVGPTTLLHGVSDCQRHVRKGPSAGTSFLFGMQFPPIPPIPLCLPPGECKLMPFPFTSVEIFGKKFPPIGSCFNTDAPGIPFGHPTKGFTVGDPRTIVWESTPRCAKDGKVRIHYVDGESYPMSNQPESSEDDMKKHTYHSMTFVTISDRNRKEMRDAMVEKRCTDSPLWKILSATPFEYFRNAGGPDFTRPWFSFIPGDEFDYTSFQVAQRDAGGDCEADE